MVEPWTQVSDAENRGIRPILRVRRRGTRRRIRACKNLIETNKIINDLEIR